MRYTLPLGPFHPGWPGALRLQLTLENGIVQAAETAVLRPRSPRPEEWAGLSLEEGLAGLSHRCADTAHAHALAYCQALEKLAGLEVPPRARFLRTLLAEIERIANHLAALGHVLHMAGLPHHAGRAMELREEVTRARQRLTGQRFFAGLSFLGGLRHDLPDLDLVPDLVRHLKGAVYRLAHRVISSRAAVAPLIGVGLLTKEQAEEHGVGGPPLRAAEGSGDVRRDQTYAAYDELDLQVVTQGGGDAFSRWMVLVLEVLESLRLLETIVAHLPGGPVCSEPVAIPAGEGLARVEAPAGPLIVRVQVDEAGRLVGLWRTPPTLAHLAALPQTLLGQRSELVGVIVASWGLCSSCMVR